MLEARVACKARSNDEPENNQDLYTPDQILAYLQKLKSFKASTGKSLLFADAWIGKLDDPSARASPSGQVGETGIFELLLQDQECRRYIGLLERKDLPVLSVLLGYLKWLEAGEGAQGLLGQQILDLVPGLIEERKERVNIEGGGWKAPMAHALSLTQKTKGKSQLVSTLLEANPALLALVPNRGFFKKSSLAQELLDAAKQKAQAQRPAPDEEVPTSSQPQERPAKPLDRSDDQAPKEFGGLNEATIRLMNKVYTQQVTQERTKYALLLIGVCVFLCLALFLGFSYVEDQEELPPPSPRQEGNAAAEEVFELKPGDRLDQEKAESLIEEG